LIVNLSTVRFHGLFCIPREWPSSTGNHLDKAEEALIKAPAKMTTRPIWASRSPSAVCRA